VQLPFEQVAPVGQTYPHVPQLDASVLRFTQTPGAAPHAVSPSGHRQPVGVQEAPSAQALPHPRQFLRSDAKFTHADGHAFGNAPAHVHAPSTQDAFARGHAFVHALASVPQ
jgi:hypothetical protein